MDVIKGIRKAPFFVDVVDNKLDIWRDAFVALISNPKKGYELKKSVSYKFG